MPIISTIADVDYVTLVQDLVFNSGEDHKVFSADIINDLIAESDESFEVFLKVTRDSPNVRIGQPSAAVGTIIDDDVLSKYFTMRFHFAVYICFSCYIHLIIIHTVHVPHVSLCNYKGFYYLP